MFAVRYYSQFGESEKLVCSWRDIMDSDESEEFVDEIRIQITDNSKEIEQKLFTISTGGANMIFHSLTFARSLRMLMNDKIMFDRYYCINSGKHCENEENIGALYFITSLHFPTRVRF